MRRHHHIRIRLAPATEGTGTEVTLTQAERDSLEHAIETSGYQRGLSSFLRDIALLGAAPYLPESRTLEDAIIAAAKDSSMSTGEWIRVVALAAIGASDLYVQIARAKKAWDDGVETWEK